jgi:GTP cyclohydrolase I
LLKKALFTVTYDQMVIVKDVEMFSLCEHHMLPFFRCSACASITCCRSSAKSTLLIFRTARWLG